MQTEIITIGDEILIGQVIDSNSAWMGQQLNQKGIQVKEIISISDEATHIKNTVHEALQRADLILITGGLGPTKDDITKSVLAEYFEMDLEFHQDTYNRLEALMIKYGRQPTEAQRIQSLMPKEATILPNEMGTAPGMWFEKDGKVLVSMPGVPYEMKYLMENEVLPRVTQQFKTLPIEHRTVLTVGIGESKLAEIIVDFENNLPDNIKLAYLPNIGRVRLRLTGKGEDRAALNELLDSQLAVLNGLIAPFIYGYGKEPFEAAVGRLLVEKGVTLATAESCTGGFIAHKLTSNSGSSAYFDGSVVAYSNHVKEQILKVKSSTLEQYGAVSEQTVTEMVQGLLQVIPSDYGIAVSGIAGPNGGTPDKPVGTIWVAVGNKTNIVTKKLQLSKNRLKNIEYTTTASLNLLRTMLLNQ